MRIPGSRQLIVLLCSLAALAGVAAPAAAASDPVVAQAHAAWRAKDVGRIAQIAQSHRNHTLAPYFEYWRVMLTPETATIKPYLERHAGSALAEQLRADWIRGLGRSGDWALIETEARQLARHENDVGCWVLRARWERGDKRAADELLAKWMTPSEFFEPCVPVAEALVKAGRVSTHDVWARARRLTEAGHYNSARRILRWLPANQAPSAALLDNAIGRPEHMLARGLFDARQPAAREMAAFAMVRIANDDPDRAARVMMPAAKSLTAEQRGWVYGHLGLVGARKLHPRALEWFRNARLGRLSDEHYGWWTRIAARDSAWSDIGFAVGHMSPAERAAPIWQYWLGRSFTARGQTAAAAKAYARAVGGDSFYSILATDALGGLDRLPPPAAPPSAAELADIAKDAGVQRVVALLRNDLRTEGLREWDWVMRKGDDRRLFVAARYFEQVGMWDRTVETADRTSRLFDLGTRYPYAFDKTMRSSAAAAKIDPALVFSIARQESRFYTNARSWAGATGLMQVMPATGAAVAKSIGLGGQGLRLAEVDFNVRIGAQYLKSLIDDLGNPMLAFAAYNAGPGRALSWRGSKPMEAAAYAESIPYDETRDYTKRVAANAHYYQMRITGAPANLQRFLGHVPASVASVAQSTAPLSPLSPQSTNSPLPDAPTSAGH